MSETYRPYPDQNVGRRGWVRSLRQWLIEKLAGEDTNAVIQSDHQRIWFRARSVVVKNATFLGIDADPDMIKAYTESLPYFDMRDGRPKNAGQPKPVLH